MWARAATRSRPVRAPTCADRSRQDDDSPPFSNPPFPSAALWIGRRGGRFGGGGRSLGSPQAAGDQPFATSTASPTTESMNGPATQLGNVAGQPVLPTRLWLTWAYSPKAPGRSRPYGGVSPKRARAGPLYERALRNVKHLALDRVVLAMAWRFKLLLGVSLLSSSGCTDRLASPTGASEVGSGTGPAQSSTRQGATGTSGPGVSGTTGAEPEGSTTGSPLDVPPAPPGGVGCGAQTCALRLEVCVSCPGRGPDVWVTDCADTDEYGNPLGVACPGAVVARCDGPEDCGPDERCEVSYNANSIEAECRPLAPRRDDCGDFGPSVCHVDEDCGCGQCDRNSIPQLSICRES